MKKRFRFVFTLALPYIITVLLPIISVMSLSITMVNNYSERILADKQVAIEHAFERFLQKLDSVETLAYTVANNSEIEKYVYAGSKGSKHTVLDYADLQQVLYNFMVNKDIFLMYYYDEKENRIITHESVFSNAALFFEHRYQMEGYTAQESVERLRNLPWDTLYSPTIKVQNKTATVIPIRDILEYRMFLPVGKINSLQGQLVFSMDVEDIFSDFINLLNGNGEFYVYDNDNTLIYSSGEQYKEFSDQLNGWSVSKLNLLDGDKEVYGMVCKSYNRVWRVEVYMTDLLDIGSIGALPPYFGVMVVFPVLLSILICIYFTHKNHRDIQGILKIFKGQGSEQDVYAAEMEEVGFDALREYAHRIINENNRFKERIISYEYARKYEIFDKLLRKTYAAKAEMIKDLETSGLDIVEGKCVVICIRYEDSSYRIPLTEDVTMKDFVNDLLVQMLDQQFELFDTSARETICVLAVGDNTDIEIVLRNIISRLNVEINYHYGIEISVGAGDVVDSLYLLNDSYLQAKAVISYNETFGNKVSLYSRMVQNKDVYYYPQEYDEKIYNYVVVGDGENAKEVIRKIYEKNFGDTLRSPSAKAVEMIKDKIRGTIESLAVEYDISLESITMNDTEDNGMNGSVLGNVVRQMRREQNIKQYFDTVYYVVDRIVAEIEKEKKIVQNNSAIKLMNYVNENYCDSTLSLKCISAVFGLNESYISNLFKKEYGENLSVVIERLRIEKASDLIKNTDMKVSEIAESVGYTSDASFRRAFKKVTGVSPGEYRELK